MVFKASAHAVLSGGRETSTIRSALLNILPSCKGEPGFMTSAMFGGGKAVLVAHMPVKQGQVSITPTRPVF